MSETSDRTDALGSDRFLEQLLEAVERPALVCDREGQVRARNDAADALGEQELTAGTAVGTLLDCDGERPWEAAIDRDAEVTDRARLPDGTAVDVECRPLTRGETVVGAVVTVTSPTAEESPGSGSTAEGSAGKEPTDEGSATNGSAGEEASTDTQSTADGTPAGPWDEEWPIYEATVDAAPDHVYATDADGRIRLMSREFERETGIPVDELVGEPISKLAEYDFVDEADVHRGREALEAVIAGERERASVTTTPEADGTELVAENRIAPIERDGEIVGAVVVVRDVTELTRRREQLRESRERLNLALESTGAGVFEWDIGTDRVYWHETASELFGLDPDTTHRSPVAFEERIHPEDTEDVLAAVDAAMAEAETGQEGDLSVEYRIVRPDGEVRWIATDGKIVFEDGEPDRLVGAIHDITERKERERELEARRQKLRTVIQSSPDPIFVKDVDCRYTVLNDAALELIDRPREEAIGATPEAVFGERIGSTVRERTELVLETEQTHTFDERTTLSGEEYALRTVRTPYYGPEGEVRGVVSVARNLTELHRQREELETLTEVQQLIQGTIGDLAAASTREGIVRTVCDRLADSAFYEFAWIGERDPSSHEISLDYAAGVSADYLEDVTITVDTSEHGLGPGGRAYRTGEVQVVDDVREDPTFEPWREVALEHGYQSVAAIPLTHGPITHGVLAVYADRPDAFSERERAGFAVLGEAVGFALGAAQNRRLLSSETLLELEFELRSPDATLTALSGQRDCRFVVDYAVQSGGDGVIYYVDVEGIDPDEVHHLLGGCDSVESVRRLDGAAGGPDLELVVSDPIYRRIAEAGACGRRSVIENGVRRIVVEAPTDVDVRRIGEIFEADFGDVELVAKREKDRSDASLWSARGEMGASLTERQRSVLRAAYYSGYYEWPRETDSEQLADSLDIASTTLLQHLRKGHKRLLAATFDQ